VFYPFHSTFAECKKTPQSYSCFKILAAQELFATTVCQHTHTGCGLNEQQFFVIFFSLDIAIFLYDFSIFSCTKVTNCSTWVLLYKQNLQFNLASDTQQLCHYKPTEESNQEKVNFNYIL